MTLNAIGSAGAISNTLSHGNIVLGNHTASWSEVWFDFVWILVGTIILARLVKGEK